MLLRGVRWLALGMVCLAALPAVAEEAAPPKTKILFIAGNPSHGPGEHEHRAGCTLLAKCLEEGLPQVDAVVSYYGWPKDESIFDGVAAVVQYCDGGEGHMVNKHAEFAQSLVDKGVGMVCLHYAVEEPKGPMGDKFLQWIGGYFEPDWSVNPHWMAHFEKLPDHAITRGVQPFSIQDEWYYHMRFPEGMTNVTPILTALPPADSLSRPDGPHSGNPAVRAAVAAGEVQHVAWCIERPDGGRGFGFTGGHFHHNWQNDDFRKLVLNAIAWTAKIEIPAGGVQSATPTDEAMKENLDPKGRR